MAEEKPKRHFFDVQKCQGLAFRSSLEIRKDIALDGSQIVEFTSPVVPKDTPTKLPQGCCSIHLFFSTTSFALAVMSQAQLIVLIRLTTVVSSYLGMHIEV